MDSGSDTPSITSGYVLLTDLSKADAPTVEEIPAIVKESYSDPYLPPPTASELQLQEDMNRKIRLLHSVHPAADYESLDRASVLVDQMHMVLFPADSDSVESTQDSINDEGRSDMDADEIIRQEYGDDVQDEESLDLLEPIEPDPIQTMSEFLNDFRLPSISELSSEPEESIEDTEHMPKAEPEKKSQVEAIKHESIEGYVNPVDQMDALDDDVDYSPESSAASSAVSSKSLKQSKWMDLGLDSGDDDLLELNDDSSLFETKQVGELEQAAEQAFIKFQASYIQQQIIEDDWLEIDPIKEKERREITHVIIQFIHHLFDSVVDKVENRNKMNELGHKLDKDLLLRHMIVLRNKLSFEYDICLYLNTKMIEYYKRQKTIRNFLILDPETQAKEFQRYAAALKLLDHWLEIAAATKKRNALLISSVYMDLAYVRNMALHTEEHLEDTIRKTLSTNKSESMEHSVDRELRLMTQMRNEISDTRLFLITRKHTLARYIDKTRKLERISDDLCMDDFIYINNQVVALDKKIEERNNELKRMRYNYHSHLHEIKHNREKVASLQTKLLSCKKANSKMLSIRDALRRKLYEVKIVHSRARKQHADLSYQGGLLSMPALMHDYDQTLARLEEKQAKVKLLKETYKQVSQRLVELESRCI